ncbi:MAG TPA: AraC family transcriptional regulator, partial [Polyangiaceae bacterium]|nr:AraC family transcriptional regulator [Polyangiaceae bacterium]
LARGAKHVIGYHVVTRGSCWVSMAGEPALELVAGAVLVFPHGDPYVISSQPERLDGALSTASTVCVPLAVKRQQGAAASARVICGFLGCDERPFDPLLSTLPRVMPLGAEPEDESVTRRLTELALVESRSSGAGSSCVLARLGELLFVDAVRRYVAVRPPNPAGWLAGLHDEQIGRALSKLHERPAQPWSLEDLAKAAGMSRSALAERFAHFVGVPPMQYLAQWRMQLAASLLRGSKSSIAEIADRVGYGSEAALSRAFKRRLGVAPTPYRRKEAATAQ